MLYTNFYVEFYFMHKICLSFQYGADVSQLSCMVSNNKSVFFFPLFCKCVHKLLRRDGKKPTGLFLCAT